MTRRKRLNSARWLPRFQFSLANLFVFVGVASVCLAVGRFHAHAGGLLGLLICGCWLTAAVAQRQWHRGAYFTAAFTAGLIWYGALSLPITPIGGELSQVFPYFPLALCFCLASLAGAAANRLLGFHEPGEISLLSATLLTIFTCVAFFLIAALIAVSRGFGAGSVRDISFYSAVSFFVLHGLILFPCGWLIALMLRDAELLAYASIRDERAVYDAVDELERRGQRLIFAEDVARQAKLEQRLVDELLPLLLSKEFLKYTPDQGYFCQHRRG